MNTKENIKSDLYRYKGKGYSFKNLLKTWAIPGFWFMYIFRKASAYPKKSFFGFYYRIILRHFSYKFGFQIPVNTKIGAGFYIGHFGTIVISHNTVIGINCNISHGVTIGAIIYGKGKGAPKIGNKVWFGANAIVVGGVTVGDNVLIAPGAYVNFDVPSNSIVMGNPAKIIARENPTENYIKNCV